MAAILDLVSVDYLTNPWVDWSIFFGGFIEGDWRKVPVDDQCLRSFKMAAFLDLASINYLTNASVDWSNFWGLKGYARFAMLFFLFQPSWNMLTCA
jgi:hypothetical protein